MISILISTYNGENYIIEQLESLLNQTLLADEVIIFDDCSTDSTVELIKEFIDKHHLDKQWYLKVNSRNIGYKANFRQGIQEVNGEYIFFCDQDDIWEPKKIERGVNTLKNNPWIEVLGTSLIHFYPDGTTRIEGALNGELERVTYTTPKSFIPHPPGCSMLVTKRYLNKVINDYSDSWAQDEFFWRMATVDNVCALLHHSDLQHRMSGTNVTSLQFKTIDERLKQANMNAINYGKLLSYAKNQNPQPSILEMIDYHVIGNKLRIDFLKNSNVKSLLKLISQYRYIYLSSKQLAGDIYFVLKQLIV